MKPIYEYLNKGGSIKLVDKPNQDSRFWLYAVTDVVIVNEVYVSRTGHGWVLERNYKVHSGDYIYFRLQENFDHSDNINIKGTYDVGGNILGLTRETYDVNDKCKDGEFMSIFMGTDIHDASMLVMPQRVNEFCFLNAFADCTKLIAAPRILPAKNLSDNCYGSMFYKCRSLKQVPELPADDLASDCYNEMFRECSSLVKPPTILPATKLWSGCYCGMFDSCMSLKESPVIKGNKFAMSCCDGMFYECGSLEKITLDTDNWNDRCSNEWVVGVKPHGTFIKKRGLEIEQGNSGIPTEWTIKNI